MVIRWDIALQEVDHTVGLLSGSRTSLPILCLTHEDYECIQQQLSCSSLLSKCNSVMPDH